METKLQDYIKRVNTPTMCIGLELQQLLTDAITEKVCDYFFSNNASDIRAMKIKQNITMMTLGLLNRTVHKENIIKLYRMCWLKFIEAVVPKGGAVGIEAGQSLVQPIIQAMLKTQHKTGNRMATIGANSIESLNKLKTNINVVRVHIRSDHGKDVLIDLRYLADRYEEIRMEDVLVSFMGNSKVRIMRFQPEMYNKKGVTYINLDVNQPLKLKHLVYLYKVDPDKLNDAGITMLHVIEMLINIQDVTFIVHPLSTFTFDLINPNPSKISDTTILKELESLVIKGIEGLAHINTRTLKVKDAVKLIEVDGKTRAYLNTYMYTQFPMRELRKRIVDKDGKQVRPTKKNLSLRNDDLFYLEYDKLVALSDEPYTFYYFYGKITIDAVTEKLGEFMDHDYTTINDPREMISTFGKSAAVTHHEMLYGEELESTGSDMHYLHISLLCSYLFAIDLNPLSPAGYLRNKGVTALERFAFEQYPDNLGAEMIKGTVSNTKSVTTSIFTGNKANIGTEYTYVEINQEQRERVMDLYEEAYNEQLYEGGYKGIEIPVFRNIAMRTKLKSGVDQLANNISVL